MASIIISGCQARTESEQPKQATQAEQSVSNTMLEQTTIASKPESSSTIVLYCTGETIDIANAKNSPAGFIFKIDTRDGSQQSLHLYNSKEMRFFSYCEAAFEGCELSISPGLIVEVAKTGGESAMVTEIDRRTGKMRVFWRRGDSGINKTFEGKCEKGENPRLQPQIF